jgi:hypothetical protein
VAGFKSDRWPASSRNGGRVQIVADIISEWRPASHWNAWPDCVGICTLAVQMRKSGWPSGRLYASRNGPMPERRRLRLIVSRSAPEPAPRRLARSGQAYRRISGVIFCRRASHRRSSPRRASHVEVKSRPPKPSLPVREERPSPLPAFRGRKRR